MFVERGGSPGETTDQERRDRAQPNERLLGRVVQCDGARATLHAFVDDGAANPIWTVGRLISVNLGTIRTVGLVYDIAAHQGAWDASSPNAITIRLELIGEVTDRNGRAVFNRGITAYPHIGAIAHRIRARDLEAVYDLSGRDGVSIGTISQDTALDARIAIDDTLDRHFAVVGTTGVGKSTAVSLLLKKAVAARPDLRVLILDPHNEFAASFPDQAMRINTATLDLPFWLFRLDEFVEVLFRGRDAVPEEVDALRDLIPVAKQLYRGTGAGSVRRSSEASGITADTPVPYRIAELIKLLDERMGMLDSKNERPFYRTLKARIEAALNDPRYHFMFASRLIEDSIHQTIGHIFRVPHEGRPITCFELAGLPSEIVNAVCSVLARLAFDLAMESEGRLKLLVLCEEAHRYMPADSRLGFAPTRHALSRIAKEGRKYGCHLGVVTQRPGELDPTVLSQCSTVFAMRLANERDQEIIRSAIADSSASTLSFLSSMGQREAIAFGEGVATTMRMKFEMLQSALVPGSRDPETTGVRREVDAFDLIGIVNRLRGGARHAPSANASADVEPQATVTEAPSPRRDLASELQNYRAQQTKLFGG